MNDNELKALEKRLITDRIQYATHGGESEELKQSRDKAFCIEFFGADSPNNSKIEKMFDDTISAQNAEELELLVLLIFHFDIIKSFDLKLAPLLTQDWHISHEDIAFILSQSKNPETAKFLFAASTLDFDYLDYQSDYREFNRKCMYALYNIGNDESMNYLELLSKNENEVIAGIAAELLNKQSEASNAQNDAEIVEVTGNTSHTTNKKRGIRRAVRSLIEFFKAK